MPSKGAEMKKQRSVLEDFNPSGISWPPSPGSRWAAKDRQLRLGNILKSISSSLRPHLLHTFPHPLPLHTNERHLKGASSHSKVLAQNQRSDLNKSNRNLSKTTQAGNTQPEQRAEALGPQIQGSRQNLTTQSPGAECTLLPQ